MSALIEDDVEERYLVDIDPLAEGSRELCTTCGHKRLTHLQGRFDCCKIIARTVNIVNDIAPMRVERATVCECLEFTN